MARFYFFVRVTFMGDVSATPYILATAFGLAGIIQYYLAFFIIF